MADNTTITAGTGTTIATDDVGGAHYQRVKLTDGAADSSAAIGGDATNGLDVDVTRLIPGTTATALGKAEDAAHTSGDTGVMALAVRTDTAAARAGTDGDYIPLTTDSIGGLRIGGSGTTGTAAGGVASIQGPAADFTTTMPNPVTIGGWDPNNNRTRVMAALDAQLNAGDPVVNFAGITPLIMATVPLVRGQSGDGNSLEQWRANINATILASAARTGTTASADQTNYNGRGLHLVIDVTSITDTPSITVTIQGKDALSGQYYTILASAAISTVSSTVLRVYPALTAAANATANDILPRTWRVNVVHGDADSITYSIGASIIL